MNTVFFPSILVPLIGIVLFFVSLSCLFLFIEKEDIS